jgi:hypothetical protein
MLSSTGIAEAAQTGHRGESAPSSPRAPSLFFFNCSKLSSKSNSHQCDDTQLLKICLRIRIGLELSPGRQHRPAMAIACRSLHRDTNFDYDHYSLHYFFPFISVSLKSMDSLLSIYYDCSSPGRCSSSKCFLLVCHVRNAVPSRVHSSWKLPRES